MTDAVKPIKAGPGEPPHLAGYIEQLGKPETLEQAIAERDAWVESAAQFSRNEDYYRGLVDSIGQAIGPASYIADDGSRSQDVLCAKVPELVADLLSAVREARMALHNMVALAEPHFTDAPQTLALNAAVNAVAKLDTLLSEQVGE